MEDKAISSVVFQNSTGMAKAGPGGIVRPKGGDDEQEELDGIDKEPLGPQGKSVGMLGKSGVSSLLPKLEPPGEGDPKGTGPKKFPKMGMPKEGKGDQGKSVLNSTRSKKCFH